MRVLIGYLTDCKSSGIDKYILQMMDLVREKNIEFDFLTNKITDDINDAVKQYKSNVYEIPTLKHPLKCLKQLKHILRQNNYDAVYLNISEAFNCLGAIAAKKCRIKKIIVHAHSSKASGKNKTIRNIRTFLHYICRPVIAICATDFIACSQVAGEWMYTKRILKSKKYKIINNPIDSTKFAYDTNVRNNMRKKLGVTQNFVIGHIGRHNFAKNPFFLIDIIKETVKLVPNAILMLIGEGEETEKIKQKAKEYGIIDKILFLGQRNDVPSLLQAMDIFILPSKFEGQPISAIEAQYSGLKVIISDTVTREAKISDYCIFEGINDPEKWAKTIKANTNYERIDIRDNNNFTVKYDNAKIREIIIEMFEGRKKTSAISKQN